MSAVSFEHRITKYEVDNHCILLRSENKTDYGKQLGTQDILVRVPGGKTYQASVNEFYVDGKFQAGIHFVGGAQHAFIVEQTLFPGHTAKITIDPTAAKIDGRTPVEVEIYVRTK